MDVRKVRYLGDYKLALAFADGSRGTADLADDLTGLLAPLRDKRVFRHAFVQDGTVNWQGGKVDLAAEFLYARAHGLPRPRSRADVERNERTVQRRLRVKSPSKASLREMPELTPNAKFKANRFAAHIERQGGGWYKEGGKEPVWIPRSPGRPKTRAAVQPSLRALREFAGVSKAALAKVIGISQAELTCLERSNDPTVSLLRRHVAALGGMLEIVAIFGKKRLVI